MVLLGGASTNKSDSAAHRLGGQETELTCRPRTPNACRDPRFWRRMGSIVIVSYQAGGVDTPAPPVLQQYGVSTLFGTASLEPTPEVAVVGERHWRLQRIGMIYCPCIRLPSPPLTLPSHREEMHASGWDKAFPKAGDQSYFGGRQLLLRLVFGRLQDLNQYCPLPAVDADGDVCSVQKDAREDKKALETRRRMRRTLEAWTSQSCSNLGPL